MSFGWHLKNFVNSLQREWNYNNDMLTQERWPYFNVEITSNMLWLKLSFSTKYQSWDNDDEHLWLTIFGKKLHHRCLTELQYSNEYFDASLSNKTIFWYKFWRLRSSRPEFMNCQSLNVLLRWNVYYHHYLGLFCDLVDISQGRILGSSSYANDEVVFLPMKS